MKKILIIAAAVLAFAGCAKEAAQIERVTIDGKEYMTFKVVAKDDVISADTKATLTRTGVFGWSDAEPIYFVAAGGTMATGSYNASAGTITVESGDWMFASNAPFDSDSKIKDFGMAKGPVVISKVEGSTLKFHHIGSVINVKFDTIPIDGYLEFWPEGGIKWAGGEFDFSGSTPELMGGGTDDMYIKWPITTADAGKDITISVPNVNYTSGFGVGLSGTSARYFQKITSKSFDLSTRPTLLNMQEVTLPSVSYTIAGETYCYPSYTAEAGVLGSTWAEAEAANDLVLDASGLYKKTYTNAPKGITFKIVKDHSWGEAWPASDLYQDITCVNGEMTITFNAVTKEITTSSRDLSYTIVGSDGLCGSNWNTGDVGNEMTEVSEGVYYKKFTGVAATGAGEYYEFKVLPNHDSGWIRSWGAADNNYSITTTGGDVEIYFDIQDAARPQITVVGFDPVFRIAGDKADIFGTAWDPTNDANKMTYNSSDNTYRITYVIPDGYSTELVEFKVTRNGTWDYAYPKTDNYQIKVSTGNTVTIIYNPTMGIEEVIIS